MNMDLDQSEELSVARLQVATIQEKVASLAITSDADAEQASFLLKSVAETKSALEVQRQFFVKPLNDQAKRINDLFRALSAPLLTADTEMRGKVMEYRRKQQELVRIEQGRLEKQAAKEQTKLDKKAETLGVTAPRVEVQTVAAPAKTVGSMTARTIWKWRLVEFAKVPDVFKEVNSAALTEAVRKGERSIPGIEVYADEVLSVR